MMAFSRRKRHAFVNVACEETACTGLSHSLGWQANVDQGWCNAFNATGKSPKGSCLKLKVSFQGC